MLKPSPNKTAWQGFYMQDDEKYPFQFNNIVFDIGKQVTGDGSDGLGNFVFTGRYDDRTLKFQKKYTTGSQVGVTPLIYDGKFVDTEDGQVVKGEYHWGTPGEGDAFEMSRSKELEQKREAAFKAQVSKVKLKAGMVRLLLEDIGMALCKCVFLWKYQGATNAQKWLATISLIANLLMALAGPVMESQLRRKMQEAAQGIPAPEIMVAGRSKGTGSTSGDHGSDYRKMDDDDDGDNFLEEDAVYLQRLEAARKVEFMELFKGNMDYIAVLMERTTRPAEIVDAAITDVIASESHVRKALVASNLLFWGYLAIFPFIFHLPCGDPIPLNAHLIFFLVAFFHVFVQLWCAILTKFGYLLLANAPQVFAFDAGLSFLGLFSAYTSCIWILSLQECGIWLWRPAALIFIFGMFLVQAAYGIYLLYTLTDTPMGLRLTQNNLLLALLKPAP